MAITFGEDEQHAASGEALEGDAGALDAGQGEGAGLGAGRQAEAAGEGNLSRFR